jgi:hypothetical protein
MLGQHTSLLGQQESVSAGKGAVLGSVLWINIASLGICDKVPVLWITHRVSQRPLIFVSNGYQIAPGRLKDHLFTFLLDHAVPPAAIDAFKTEWLESG